MNEIIKIENLIFDYVKEVEDERTVTRAIDDISLSIEKGSFVAIIGKNGSGKSTLAKNLNGLLVPTAGKIYVNGFDTADDSHIWDVRQSCGMVFQNPDNQLVSAIVEDDVAFGPENIGIEPAQIRIRVDEALRAVGMEKFATKAPHLLSGGQKQRIAIAGVVAMKPECIVFDEPTAMLDPKGRAEIMDIIEKLHQEGITCILITHFMEEAAKADRIVIMDEGKIVLDGKPHEVFKERDKIKAINLDVPLEAEIAYRLRKKGFDIPEDIISTDEMVKYLSALKKR